MTTSQRRYGDLRRLRLRRRVRRERHVQDPDVYDREGNIVKTILSNFNQRYTSTASANGKTLSTNDPLVFITRGDDADIRVGLRNAYHVPGAGVVLLDAGRLIFDANGDVVFEAGQHELLNGSVDAFCGYFDS